MTRMGFVSSGSL